MKTKSFRDLWKNDSILALLNSLVLKCLRFLGQNFAKTFIISSYTKYSIIIWNLEFKKSLIIIYLFIVPINLPVHIFWF
jgi:hypothetical protein